MRYSTRDALVVPECGHSLEIGVAHEEQHGEVKEGALVDPVCHRRVTVSNFIPRFVQQNGYVTSFGYQWRRFQRTQLDRFNGTRLSHSRFFHGTGWTPEELNGQKVLEVGCGAGRFTEVLLEAGAEVYAFDASDAVDVCLENLGHPPRLCLVQAALEAAPFRKGYFDKVFCYGVLQHTPDVRRAFLSLIPFLKSGGQIAIDVYRKLSGLKRFNRWGAKYWWRPLTKRLPAKQLARIVEWYVPRWMPIDNVLQQVPLLGRALIAVVPCWNYTGVLPLGPEQLKEWAILDTFDALAAYHDSPQTVSGVRSWFEEAGLTDINVRIGGNGILGNARKP